jgi:hypothetical protein
MSKTPKELKNSATIKEEKPKDGIAAHRTAHEIQPIGQIRSG